MTPTIQPKTLAWSLAGFVSAGLILGVLLIRNDLHSPFRLAGTAPAANDNLAAAGDNSQLLALRNKDTDGDGLSDYDELYVHDTSPYLRDSDSDGDADGDELAAGQDPNCPKGQVCEAVPVVNAATNAGLTNEANGNDDSNLNGNIDVIGELRNVDIATLRQTLLNSGAPKETLDQMTDEQLRQTYNDILNEQAGGLNLNINGAADSVNGAANQAANAAASSNSGASNQPAITADDLTKLTPAEIRRFLVTSGIDSATLDSVDDATLQQIFLQAIQESQGSP